MGQAKPLLNGELLERAIMKMHKTRFMARSPEFRATMEARAASLRDDQESALAQDLAYASGQLEIHLGRLAAVQAAGHPRMILSTCKLGPREQEALDQLFLSKSYSRAAVEALRAAAMDAPPPPEPLMQGLIESFPLTSEPLPSRPAWLPALCADRDDFKNTAFKVTFDGQVNCYKFVFAKQHPYMACFSPLQPREVPLAGTMLAAGSWKSLATNAWDHNFSVMFRTILGAHDVKIHARST